MKKITILAFCFLLCFCNSSKLLANAQYYYEGEPIAEEDISEISSQLDTSLEDRPQFYFILTSDIFCDLAIEDGYAACSAFALGKPPLVSKIKMVIHLQKLNNSGEFENVISWQQTNLSEHIVMTKNYKLSSSGTYRIKTLYYVYDQEDNCEISIGTSKNCVYTK